MRKEVNRLDFGIRVEGVFVEEHRASSVVSYVEPIREKFVVNKHVQSFPAM